MLIAGATGAIQTLSMSILSFVLNFFIQAALEVEGIFVLSVGINFMMFSMFFAIGVNGVFASIGSMMQGQEDDTGLNMFSKARLRLTPKIRLSLRVLFPKRLNISLR